MLSFECFRKGSGNEGSEEKGLVSFVDDFSRKMFLKVYSVN